MVQDKLNNVCIWGCTKKGTLFNMLSSTQLKTLYHSILNHLNFSIFPIIEIKHHKGKYDKVNYFSYKSDVENIDPIDNDTDYQLKKSIKPFASCKKISSQVQGCIYRFLVCDVVLCSGGFTIMAKYILEIIETLQHYIIHCLAL